jgi:hypothetical protein
MKKTTVSVLMSALMISSGFAVAQTSTAPSSTGATPATPATSPTRAEVKSEITRDTTKAGEKNLGEPPKAGTSSDTSRAEVKSAVTRDTTKAGEKNLGEPPKVSRSSNTSRTEVKAGIDGTDRELSTGEKAAPTKPSAASAKRKAMRDERRAAAKAKNEMNSGSPATSSQAPMNK